LRQLPQDRRARGAPYTNLKPKRALQLLSRSNDHVHAVLDIALALQQAKLPNDLLICSVRARIVGDKPRQNELGKTPRCHTRLRRPRESRFILQSDSPHTPPMTVRDAVRLSAHDRTGRIGPTLRRLTAVNWSAFWKPTFRRSEQPAGERKTDKSAKPQNGKARPRFAAPRTAFGREQRSLTSRPFPAATTHRIPGKHRPHWRQCGNVIKGLLASLAVGRGSFERAIGRTAACERYRPDFRIAGPYRIDKEQRV
jgi:hypothetical protein